MDTTYCVTVSIVQEGVPHDRRCDSEQAEVLRGAAARVDEGIRGIGVVRRYSIGETRVVTIFPTSVPIERFLVI